MTGPEESLCPECRAKIYLTDDVCMNCGAKLEQGRLVDESAAPEAPPGAPAGGQWQAVVSEQGPAAQRAAEQPQVSYATGPATAWHPSDADLGGGFFASISRAWTFMKQSVGMAFKDKDLILPSVFSVLVNVCIIGGVIAILWATGLFQVMDADEETGMQKIINTGAGVLTTFVSLLITYFFTGMTVNLIDVHLTGRDATLGEAFADARKNFMAIMWLAVVATLIAMVRSALRSKQGRGLGDVASDAIGKVWQVATYLMLPIIILEDVSLGEASKRAWKLHSEGAIGVVVGEIGVSVLTGVIGFVGFLLGAGAGVGIYFLNPALLPVAIGVGAIIFIGVVAFTMYVRTAYYTCLYLWAAAAETVGAKVPAPAPLVAAMAS